MTQAWAACPFETLVKGLGQNLLGEGEHVDTGHWQALKDVPQTKTIELRNVIADIRVYETPMVWSIQIEPNQPWVELQFQERISGTPMNPGESYKLWPWYRGNVETHKPQGQFSHTYMERFWPKMAGGGKIYWNDVGQPKEPNQGIRYEYGDLNDLIDLLGREPYTRQAYLPVFFPEDTGAHHGERIPCTLGYHFMVRDGKLNCTYLIRSCDFLRHFRDDVYLAGRLMQWVLDELRRRSHDILARDREFWDGVEPGILTFHAMSLHVFEGDLPKLRREYGV